MSHLIATIRQPLEIPNGPYNDVHFINHLNYIEKKMTLTDLMEMTGVVLSFPFVLLGIIYYVAGASLYTFIPCTIICILVCFAGAAYIHKKASLKMTLERCFFFNKRYTDLLLAHPDINRNILGHLNFRLYTICEETTRQTFGVVHGEMSFEEKKKTASRLVLGSIMEEFETLKDELLTIPDHPH